MSTKAAKKKTAPVKVQAQAVAEQIAAFRVEDWPIDRPIPYARNARKIPQVAVDKVAASIKEFGWRQPIVVDGDGIIVVGHTRLLAARKLGRETVPVHVAEDLTPAQIQAYRLADNRAHQETDWDKELLHVELSELAESFSNLDAVTGFDMKEINELLGYREEPLGQEGDADTQGQVGLLGVVIECQSDAEQMELLEEFEGRGLKCRALV